MDTSMVYGSRRIESPDLPECGSFTPVMSKEEKQALELEALLAAERQKPTINRVFKIVVPAFSFIAAAFMFLPAMPAVVVTVGTVGIGGTLVYQEIKKGEYVENRIDQEVRQ